MYSQDEIWGDDDLLSPVVRRPGCYRSVCIDIDVQDLAIAALTDTASMPAFNVDSSGQGGVDSPNSVAQFDFAANAVKSALCSPLGDEQATSVSLPLIRALVCAWLKDAFTLNSLVADELLHHIYRLLSNPDSLLHDPSLHRVLHGLMKSTFLRLLGELQRLGCSIVFASFTKITIATNKHDLSDAEEYVDFVVSTIRKRASENPGLGDALARISLRPALFHSQLVFLDEFNHSSMILRRVQKDEVSDERAIIVSESNSSEDDTVVVAMGDLDWSVINYIGSNVAQEYFKLVIGRFSKSVLEKQISLESSNESSSFASQQTRAEQLLKYRKLMVSKHFATLCTRAVDDILKDEEEDHIEPPLAIVDSDGSPSVPALEFVKNVVAVLELDSDLENEVQGLKRSLLAQLGIAEYAKAALWKNPCPSFVLTDVFCAECNESKDVNLCYVPPRDSEEDDYRKTWVCDCDAPYDVTTVEKRLISLVQRKVARYQLQDLRCVRTSRVSTRALAPFSDCSAGLKLDISREEMQAELTLLKSLAQLHELDSLQATTEGLLAGFR
jgi:DNA polymerase epsilon subunit 1